MRTFVLSSGGRLFYPCVIYYYRSVKESLKLLNARENFGNECEKWCSLVDVNRIMSDVYHVRMWKASAINSKWFFEQTRI